MHHHGHHSESKHHSDNGRHRHGESHAELLELDALIHRSHLETLVDGVADLTHREPATIVDLGAGTGAATFALAQRFPGSKLIALDISPDMLDRIRSAARENGLTARLDTIEADLDATLPDLGIVDLAWAASSLHHLDDPEGLIRQVFGVLEPGGLFVVTEMDAHPRFLPHDVGIGTPGLEARCHEAAAAQGWNAYPDWSASFERAGFDVLEQRRIEIDIDPAPPSANTYSYELLRRMRHGLENSLTKDDLDTIDLLTDRHGPHSVLRRTDLTVRGARTVWVGRVPHSEETR